MSKEHGITLHSAIEKLEAQRDPRWIELFQHGTLSIEFYAPRGTDPQTPHTRDEVYVVASGSGEFVAAESRRKLGQDYRLPNDPAPLRLQKWINDDPGRDGAQRDSADSLQEGSSVQPWALRSRLRINRSVSWPTMPGFPRTSNANHAATRHSNALIQATPLIRVDD